MNKILLTWLAVCSLQVAAHAADRVKIGYPDASGSFLSLPLGQKTGSFQKEGIQSDLIRIRSTVALTALVSGELEYHSVLGPAVAAAIRGMPVKIVACYTPLTATPLLRCLSSNRSRISAVKPSPSTVWAAASKVRLD
jgi:ABC-type nitrate/sulfonate/bicarbonate transport system substrate-binding protein